jgi:hypothetical protein
VISRSKCLVMVPKPRVRIIVIPDRESKQSPAEHRSVV